MRVVIENIFLFLLPTLVFCGAKVLRSEPRRPLGAILGEAPLVLLFVCGFVLVGGLRIVVALTSESGTPSQHYVPPRMGKDGQIEPGRME